MILRFFFLVFSCLLFPLSGFSESSRSLLERAKAAFDNKNYDEAYNALSLAWNQIDSEKNRRRNKVWRKLSGPKNSSFTKQFFRSTFRTEYERLLEMTKEQEELLAKKQKEEAERKWKERKKIEDTLAASLEGKDQTVREAFSEQVSLYQKSLSLIEGCGNAGLTNVKKNFSRIKEIIEKYSLLEEEEKNIYLGNLEKEAQRAAGTSPRICFR